MRRASVQLLSLPEGSTTLPTQYGGSDLCAWQQQQLDPTLDDEFKQNDAVYLLLVLAKKYRFVGGVSLGLDSDLLTFEATLFDEASAFATSQTMARLELQYSASSPPPPLDYQEGNADGQSTESNLLAVALHSSQSKPPHLQPARPTKGPDRTAVP